MGPIHIDIDNVTITTYSVVDLSVIHSLLLVSLTCTRSRILRGFYIGTNCVKRLRDSHMNGVMSRENPHPPTVVKAI